MPYDVVLNAVGLVEIVSLILNIRTDIWMYFLALLTTAYTLKINAIMLKTNICVSYPSLIFNTYNC